MKYLTALCTFTLLIVLGCSSKTTINASGGSGDNTSGVLGEVREGPIRPVEIPGVDNTAPLANARIRINSASGDSIAVAITDTTGKYSAALKAGAYILQPLPFPSGMPRSKQDTLHVVVVDNQFTALNISYDTGIR